MYTLCCCRVHNHGPGFRSPDWHGLWALVDEALRSMTQMIVGAVAPVAPYSATVREPVARLPVRSVQCSRDSIFGSMRTRPYSIVEGLVLAFCFITTAVVWMPRPVFERRDRTVNGIARLRERHHPVACAEAEQGGQNRRAQHLRGDLHCHCSARERGCCHYIVLPSSYLHTTTAVDSGTL